MTAFEELKTRIGQKDIRAAVIGLGYVGLPLAHSMCRARIRVTGLDIDPQKIEWIENGTSYIDAVEDQDLQKWTADGFLTATTDFTALKEADFIIACVPTPLDNHFNPDLSYVEKTMEAVRDHLRPGQVIVLESTTYPGTMTEVVKPILEQSGLKDGQDFHLAYSPERENPGSQNFSTSTIPKVIGADSEEALALSKEFYALFIDEMVPVSSMAVAEASKIMENVFRSVNIALVNELKVIFDKMGLNIWEIIEAVKTKPFGYMPFYPGPGMGGHCIPIDPFYLSWKAKECGVPTRFIELAGEINTAMPEFVVRKTIEGLNMHAGKALKDSHILILGIAYKKNVADQRETPAFPVMNALLSQGAAVDFYDPHIPEIKPNRNYPDLTGKQSIAWDSDKIAAYDACVVITDHDDVDYSAVLKSGTLIIDSRNVFAAEKQNNHIIRA